MEDIPHSSSLVTKANLSKVKLFIKSIYPINYSDSFYNELVDNPFCRVFIVKDEVAAVVCCKSEYVDNVRVMYIQSLGVSPLYREKGFGSALFNFVVEKAKSYCLPGIALHVQVNNKAAIDFYHNRGFEIRNTIAGYYHRCEPTNAYLMLKSLQ